MAAVRLDTNPPDWVWPFSTLHSNEYEIRAKFPDRTHDKDKVSASRPTPKVPLLNYYVIAAALGWGVLHSVFCVPNPKSLHQSLLNHLSRNFKFIALTMRQQTITLTK